MPGLEDVFGRKANRPDHPDFWRISEVILAADGAIQAATTDDEREAAWKARTGAVVDRDSVTYAAIQRAMLAFGRPDMGAAFGLTEGRTGALTIAQQSAAAALWTEAFVFGALFQQRGGHQG